MHNMYTRRVGGCSQHVLGAVQLLLQVCSQRFSWQPHSFEPQLGLRCCTAITVWCVSCVDREQSHSTLDSVISVRSVGPSKCVGLYAQRVKGVGWPVHSRMVSEWCSRSWHWLGICTRCVCFVCMTACRRGPGPWNAGVVPRVSSAWLHDAGRLSCMSSAWLHEGGSLATMPGCRTKVLRFKYMG